MWRRIGRRTLYLPNSEGTTGPRRATLSPPCEIQMKKSPAKPAEHKCPACSGTGFPTVMQPVQPGRKIYPAPCKKCGGKGRITEAAN